MSDFENGRNMNLFIVLITRKSLVKAKEVCQLQGHGRLIWEERQRETMHEHRSFKNYGLREREESFFP